MDPYRPSAPFVILGSAAVLVLGAFLPWLTVGSGSFSLSFSALDGIMFPTYALPAVLGVIAAVLVGLRTFGSSTRDGFAGFDNAQITVIAGLWSVLITASILFEDFTGGSRGIGYWLSLLGSIGLLVGGVMLGREGPAATAAPPRQF